MMVEMQQHPSTMHDLSEHTGLAIGTVRRYVLVLHKYGGCHIAQWHPDKRGGLVIPAFSLGNKKDAARPGRQNPAAAVRRSRSRKKAKELQRALTL
jgi:hypothetical protein